MLKVLNINDTDIANCRFNGYDLRPFLMKYDIDSSMLVWEKHSKESFVHPLGKFEMPLAWLLAIKRSFRQTDIVHLHLVYNRYFPHTSLPLIASLKPTVWTAHDQWILGIEPNILENSDIEIIVASEFMFAKVKQIPYLKDKVVHLVPFGINPAHIHPIDTVKAKTSLGLDPDKVAISFRCTDRPVKGLDLIREALLELPNDTKRHIQVIGFSEKGHIEMLKGEFPVLDCGWVDTDTIQTIYNASDLILMPSREESFGMVALEAMACGKPVIVGEGTALPELCPDTVVPCEVEPLSGMIDWLVWDEEERKGIGQANLAHVRDHHMMEHQAELTAAVYRGMGLE
jgi:glycosyltransferase involved in cell wall biosynthesis